MYMENKLHRSARCGVIIAVLAVMNPFVLSAQAKVLELTTSKKLTVRFLQNKNTPFIHAQLLVFYSQEPFSAMERARANLTLYNLFERDLDTSMNGVQRALYKLGNDVQFEQRPDFLRISVNFLPDRMGQFAAFLNKLFTFNSFSLDRFNRSKEQYWNLLVRDRDWKKELALQLAYGHFFFQATETPAVLPADALRRINLVHIRSFHRRTYRPDNALLVIKGNFNPYISLGFMEREMQSNWPQLRPEPRPETTITPNHRFFVLNIPQSEIANLYYFDLAPTFDDSDFLPVYLLNRILFGFPGGRLFRSNRPLLLSRNYQFDDEIFVCRPLPIICQHVRVQYEDLEEFLILIDGEKRKLTRAPIENEELLVALNSAMGQLDVASANVDHGVRMEVDRYIASQRENPIAIPAAFKRISLDQINHTLEETTAARPRTNGTERGVLVIVGNAAQILANLKMLRPDMIELNKN